MPLPTFPTHLTLSSEERARIGVPEPGSAGVLRASRTTIRIKQHTFPVTYLDGIEGECRYERLGPAWHRFEYRYGPAEDLRSLPRQYHTQALGNTATDIEALGQERAERAFADAVTRERDDCFRRATAPTGSTPDPKAYQFSAKRAKQIGGQYALCVRLGAKLIPVSGCLFDTLDDANAAWEERSEAERASLVVACACRWSRRWEQPRYNRLTPRFSPPSGGTP